MKKMYDIRNFASGNDAFGAERGFVLMASMMMVVILSVLVAGMIREAGNSKTSSVFARDVVRKEQEAKIGQILGAEIAVRASADRLADLVGTGGSNGGVGIVIPDPLLLLNSLKKTSDKDGSIVDSATTAKQPYVVMGEKVVYVDVDWQGDFEASSGGIIAFGECGQGASMEEWDCFGNTSVGMSAKVGADGALGNANAVSDNYRLFSLQLLVQDATLGNGGVINLQNQTFDVNKPYSEVTTTYKYDFTRTPPGQF